MPRQATLLTAQQDRRLSLRPLAARRASRRLEQMRRPAILLSLIASLSLVLTPFAMLHAHVDSDHADVVVHGGHSHGVDLHADHHDNYRDGHDGHQEPASDFGDSASLEFVSSATAHVVQLSPVVLDHPSHHPIKVIANPDPEPAQPPPLVTPLEAFPFLDNVLVIRRAHLRPLLRGPPH